MTLSEDEGEPSRITAPLGSAPKPADGDVVDDPPPKKEAKKDTTFIVTLEGVEGQKAAAGQRKKEAPPSADATEKKSDAAKVMAAFKFKPTTATPAAATTSKGSATASAPSATSTQVNSTNKSEVCCSFNPQNSSDSVFCVALSCEAFPNKLYLLRSIMLFKGEKCSSVSSAGEPAPTGSQADEGESEYRRHISCVRRSAEAEGGCFARQAQGGCCAGQAEGGGG